MKYWINVRSKDHVLNGIAGGFLQSHQGKDANFQLLRENDVIFFYSPGTLFRAGEILQSFTAVARVKDDAPYQVEGTAPAGPMRRNVAQLPGKETPIGPLLPTLDFIQDKANWGASVGRGLFEIGVDDARCIAAAMQVDIGSPA